MLWVLELTLEDTEISSILRSPAKHYKASDERLCIRNKTGNIIGLLCLKRMNFGWYIGPFYANSNKIAERFFICRG